MNSDLDVGRRIVAVREHYKLSQVDFAGEINVAKNTLNGYERGKRPLTAESIKRIHDRFGVSTDWLLFGHVGQPSHDLALKLGPSPKIKADLDKAKPVEKSRTKRRSANR